MSGERRYDEDEVRRIFAEATEAEAEAHRPATAGRDGLTLAELEEIGAEAGIARHLVSEAAARVAADPAESGVDLTSPVPAGAIESLRGPRLLGLPLGVTREVALSRDLTEEEWGSLVMDARRTFSARGRVEVVGRSREWRNGNLYVAVEPEGEGARLRMGSRKSSAIELGAGGAAMLGFAIVVLVFAAISGEIAEAGAFLAPTVLAGVGLALLGAGPLRLPGWAKERSGQMAWLGQRALALTEGEPPGGATGDGAVNPPSRGPRWSGSGPGR